MGPIEMETAVQTETNTAGASNRELSSPRFSVRRILEKYSVLIALVIAITAFSIALPRTFPTTGNLSTIISSQAINLILALAVTLPLRTLHFDLSFAMLMILSGCCTAVLIVEHNWPVPMAVGAGLFVGIVGGALNALLVVGLGIDSFIATIGTQAVFGGLALAVTNVQTVTNFPNSLTALSRTTFLGIPSAAWAAWVLAAMLWFVYEYTPFGRQMLFVGGNQRAAQLAGLPVKRIVAVTYLLVGLFVAAAGILLAGQLGAVDPSIGGSFLLQPFAAVFLSAACIQIGRVNIVGTVISLYLLAVGVAGLQLLGAPAWVSECFNGLVLLLAVGFSNLIGRYRRAK